MLNRLLRAHEANGRKSDEQRKGQENELQKTAKPAGKSGAAKTKAAKTPAKAATAKGAAVKNKAAAEAPGQSGEGDAARDQDPAAGHEARGKGSGAKARLAKHAEAATTAKAPAKPELKPVLPQAVKKPDGKVVPAAKPGVNPGEPGEPNHRARMPTGLCSICPMSACAR